MKIYSDTLTKRDLYAALPNDVCISDIREIKSRKALNAWELHLEGTGLRHKRQRNSVATWDDHGIWMDRLYSIDPCARIAWYLDRDHFYTATEYESSWRQQSRFRTVRETGTAPWLQKRAACSA